MWATAANLLLVDDHPVYREGLVGALRASAPQRHVESAALAEQALQRLDQRADIDLLIADYRLPDRSGLALIEEVRRRWPTVACVLLTGVDEPGIAQRASDVGCLGCLSKMLDGGALVRAIDSILRGGRVFSEYGSSMASTALTERQAVVLQLVSSGLSNKQIAREIGITERTVKDHMTTIFSRLGVASRAEAVAQATAAGLISVQRSARRA